MVIDSSALLAILLDEPEGQYFLDIVLRTVRAKISTASVLEISIVLHNRKKATQDHRIDRTLEALQLEVVGVDSKQLFLARDAFRRFGKGHHRAGLNFGDCFSYALAKQTGEPLLYKGNDFSHTDIPAVTEP